jgi:hypothetical protein
MSDPDHTEAAERADRQRGEAPSGVEAGVQQFSLFGQPADDPRDSAEAPADLAAADLDAQAQALWEADPRAVKPAWSQLGDTTKGVWRDYVMQGARPEDWARPGWDEACERPRGG